MAERLVLFAMEPRAEIGADEAAAPNPESTAKLSPLSRATRNGEGGMEITVADSIIFQYRRWAARIGTHNLPPGGSSKQEAALPWSCWFGFILPT